MRAEPPSEGNVTAARNRTVGALRTLRPHGGVLFLHIPRTAGIAAASPVTGQQRGERRCTPSARRSTSPVGPSCRAGSVGHCGDYAGRTPSRPAVWAPGGTCTHGLSGAVGSGCAGGSTGRSRWEPRSPPGGPRTRRDSRRTDRHQAHRPVTWRLGSRSRRPRIGGPTCTPCAPGTTRWSTPQSVTIVGSPTRVTPRKRSGRCCRSDCRMVEQVPGRRRAPDGGTGPIGAGVVGVRERRSTRRRRQPRSRILRPTAGVHQPRVDHPQRMPGRGGPSPLPPLIPPLTPTIYTPTATLLPRAALRR